LSAELFSICSEQCSFPKSGSQLATNSAALAALFQHGSAGVVDLYIAGQTRVICKSDQYGAACPNDNFNDV